MPLVAGNCFRNRNRHLEGNKEQQYSLDDAMDKRRGVCEQEHAWKSLATSHDTTSGRAAVLSHATSSSDMVISCCSIARSASSLLLLLYAAIRSLSASFAAAAKGDVGGSSKPCCSCRLYPKSTAGCDAQKTSKTRA